MLVSIAVVSLLSEREKSEISGNSTNLYQIVSRTTMKKLTYFDFLCAACGLSFKGFECRSIGGI